MIPEKQLNYADTGGGDVSLIFLHYFGGSSNTWAAVCGEVSNSFRCIAVDLPGFGHSFVDSEALSVDYCAKKVEDLLGFLGLKKYILVGHSMGGKVALALAARQPVGLSALILVAPSPPTPEPMNDEQRDKLLQAHGDAVALEKVVNSVAFIPLTGIELDNAVADNLLASPMAWQWWITKGSREDISSRMSAIKVPVKVISGANDPNFSTTYLRTEMLKYFPAATYAEVEHAGHLMPVERPAELARLIRQFAG